MKTFSLRTEDAQRGWVHIDAENLVLGRIASAIAIILRGKDKPEYTPHVDCGEFVVVTNADKIAMTGNSKGDEEYFWHTGYIGGVKKRTKSQILKGKYPERLLMLAVQRMMPKNSLSRKQMTKLRIYAGAEHPHAAQNPKTLDMAAMNSKNKRSA